MAGARVAADLFVFPARIDILPIILIIIQKSPGTSNRFVVYIACRPR
jgi:hypothetical protein